MPLQSPRPTSSFFFRAEGIALCYALFASIWITASDWLAFELFTAPSHLSIAQTLKGYVFVAGTTAALYLLVAKGQRDLAERNRQLRDSGLFSQSLIDASPLGIVVLDDEERVVLWSRGAEKILGWREDETLGRPPDAVHGRGTRFRRWLERVARGETVSDFETVRYHKDGHEVDVSISAAPLYNAEEDVSGSIALLQDIGERVRAESLLRRSEERLRAVFDTTHTAFLLVNLEREVVMLNRRSEELFDEIYGTPIIFGDKLTDIVRAEHAEQGRSLFEQAKSGSLATLQVEIEARGKTYVLEIRVAPVYGQDGRVEAVLYNATDMTDLREAERARKETDHRFKTLFDSVDDILIVHEFWRHDRKGRIVQVNDAACRTLRYDREKLLRMTIDQVYVADPEAVERRVQRLDKIGSTEGEAYAVASDGERIPVEFKTHRINLDDRPVLISSCRDIRERRQMEGALRKSEAEYRTLFRTNPRPMWVYDLETYRFLRVNNAAVAHYGYSEEDFLAMSIFDIRPSEERSALLENVRNARQDLEHSGPWRHQKKDGTVIEVEIDSHILEMDGRPAVLVLTHDVTERNRLSREINRYNAELRAMSVRLLETQETERRRLARELHDEAGARLTALQMCLAMAKEAVADTSPGSVAEIIEAQDLARDLADMVRQLSMNLRPGVLDDLGLVAAIEWFIGRYRRQTGITVSFYHEMARGERLGAEIETSAYRIVQEALTNVARHSRAMQATVMLNRTDEELRLHVVDEGQGFDSAKIDGDSIGIASMRERAQLTGGKLEVSSEPKKGTRVSATLPHKFSNNHQNVRT